MSELTFEEKLKNIVLSEVINISLINDLKEGKVSRQDLKNYVVLLYGEARSSLRIKIPERIKMCPLEFGHVRKFWCKMLKEESGGFLKNKDHATLIIPTCMALGANQNELTNAYLNACKKLKNFNSENYYESYSIKNILTELTRMWIDEYILSLEANNIADALIENYKLKESDVFYFRLHAVEDVEHSKAGLKEIMRIVKNDQLKDHVINKTREALENFPIWM